MVQPDALRYYVSRTNPEHMQTSFSYEEFSEQVEQDLVGVWNNAVNGFLQCVHAEPDGVVPAEYEPDLRAVGLLEWAKARLERFYDIDEFSLRQASAILYTYTEGCGNYLKRVVLPVQGGRGWEYAQRLGSLAYLIKGLACFAAPLMPAFAQQLWTTLGLPGEVQEQGWSQVEAPFPSNTRVGPVQQWFRSPSEDSQPESITYEPARVAN
jgi:methionyl-tRNA synthetase